MGQFDTIIRLRRDNDFNYAKVENTFIPADGEICLVDTARSGLRFKCGDGVSTWAELSYVDEYIVKGYFFEDNFYYDLKHTQMISGEENKAYIDIQEKMLYYFDGYDFIPTGSNTIKEATEEEAGIMKLYQSLGSNIDGAISQKVITNELNEKIEVALNAEEELLILSNNF